jgi:cytochrome P450 monooxygenase
MSDASGSTPTSVFPVLDGAWPVLGHMPEMYRRFPELCARGRAHGPLFWIHGGPGAKQLMYCDPDALQLLKHPATSSSFYTEGFSALLGNTLFAFDGDEHRRVRQPMTPPFTPQRVRASDVIAIVTDAAERRVERWVKAPSFDVLAEIREMALEIIFRIVGVPVTDVAEWRTQYTRFLLAGVPSSGRIRGPIYWYASRARNWIDERLGAIVDRFRASQDSSTLVGSIANCRDEDGRFLDRALVLANLRLLVFAGHETTASSMAWTAHAFAASPTFQRRAIEEVASIDDFGAAATDTARFTFAEAMFREALRRYPPVHSVLRRMTAPVEVNAGLIPKGTLVNIPFVYLLGDPTRFPDPTRFDPDRLKERPRPGTLETAMFGAGPHFCLGYHVAIAEGTLFNLVLARTMHRRGLELRPTVPGPIPRPIYLPLGHPPSKLTLQFTTRQSPREAHAHP